MDDRILGALNDETEPCIEGHCRVLGVNTQLDNAISTDRSKLLDLFDCPGANATPLELRNDLNIPDRQCPALRQQPDETAALGAPDNREILKAPQLKRNRCGSQTIPREAR